MTPTLKRALNLRAKHPEVTTSTLIALARQPETAPLPWTDGRRHLANGVAPTITAASGSCKARASLNKLCQQVKQ